MCTIYHQLSSSTTFPGVDEVYVHSFLQLFSVNADPVDLTSFLPTPAALMLIIPVLHLFLATTLSAADESPQQVVIPNEGSEDRIKLETELNTQYARNCESHARLMACDGVCYKNNSNNLRFFLLGDTGGLPIYPYTTYAQNLVAKTLARIGDEENIEFIVSAGDNIYYTGVQNEFDQRFRTSFENVYKGKALEKPWYFIAGNHDHFGNISGQIAYTNRSQRWTYPASYYKVSYAFGKNATLVDFLMIDTIVLCGNTRDITEAGFIDMLFATVEKNPHTPKDPVAAQMELDWIEQQLSSSRADYLFVVGHYPLYSISDHGSVKCLIEKLKPLLEKYHASAYVAGHDHTLQHIVTEHSLSSDDTEKNEIHYIVSGAASRSAHSVKHMDTIPEGSLRFNYPTGFNPFSQIGFSTGGFVYANVEKDGATLTFYNGKGNIKYSCKIAPRRKSATGRSEKWISDFSSN